MAQRAKVFAPLFSKSGFLLWTFLRGLFVGMAAATPLSG
jgi:hypothetical protein